MAKPRDPVQIAKGIYDQFLTKNDPDSVPSDPEPEKPNPKAQAAGRKGGLKGGKARAAALTPRKRKQIAKKAARARWNPNVIEKPTTTVISVKENSKGRSRIVKEEVESKVPKIHNIIERIEPSERHLICIFTSTNGYGYSIDVIDKGFEYGKDFFGFRTRKAVESAALAQYELVKKDLSDHLIKRAEKLAKRRGKLVPIAEARDRHFRRKQSS